MKKDSIIEVLGYFGDMEVDFYHNLSLIDKKKYKRYIFVAFKNIQKSIPNDKFCIQLKDSNFLDDNSIFLNSNSFTKINNNLKATFPPALFSLLKNHLIFVVKTHDFKLMLLNQKETLNLIPFDLTNLFHFAYKDKINALLDLFHNKTDKLPLLDIINNIIIISNISFLLELAYKKGFKDSLLLVCFQKDSSHQNLINSIKPQNKKSPSYKDFIISLKDYLKNSKTHDLLSPSQWAYNRELMSFKAIARKLSISEDEVKEIYFQAMEKIKFALKDDYSSSNSPP